MAEAIGILSKHCLSGTRILPTQPQKLFLRQVGDVE